MAPLRIVKKSETANLLALDGGGIKGISTLVILAKIMERVKALDPKPNDPCLPLDYFDLAGGTSTGGIIALMLFRLRMSADEAIKAYQAMGSSVFPKTSWTSRILKGTLYDDTELLKAIDLVVEKYGPTPQDRQNKGSSLLVDGQSRMFMCTTLKERGEAVLMRSYEPPQDALPYSWTDGDLDNDTIKNITIKNAVRATSAAPMYFPELKLPTAKSKSVIFWDGGVLNNNPIDQLWRTRMDLVNDTDPAPHISCVLSLGTSFCQSPKAELGFVAGLKEWLGTVGALVMPTLEKWTNPVGKAVAFLTNTDAKHVDFSRYIIRLQKRTEEADRATQYFRFNCPTGSEEIDMADATKMKWLADTTESWLMKDADCTKKIEAVAQLLVSTKPKRTG